MKNFVTDVLKESKKYVIAGAKVIAGAATFIIGMGVGTIIERRNAKKANDNAEADGITDNEIFDGETTEEEDEESETEEDEDAE